MKEGNLKFKFEDLCIILAGHLYNNFSIGKVEKMIPSSVFK